MHTLRTDTAHITSKAAEAMSRGQGYSLPLPAVPSDLVPQHMPCAGPAGTLQRLPQPARRRCHRRSNSPLHLHDNSNFAAAEPIPAFAWNDFGKPWKGDIRTAKLGIEPGSSRTKNKTNKFMWSLDHVFGTPAILHGTPNRQRTTRTRDVLQYRTLLLEWIQHGCHCARHRNNFQSRRAGIVATSNCRSPGIATTSSPRRPGIVATFCLLWPRIVTTSSPRRAGIVATSYCRSPGIATTSSPCRPGIVATFCLRWYPHRNNIQPSQGRHRGNLQLSQSWHRNDIQPLQAWHCNDIQPTLAPHHLHTRIVTTSSPRRAGIVATSNCRSPGILSFLLRRLTPLAMDLSGSRSDEHIEEQLSEKVVKIRKVYMGVIGELGTFVLHAEYKLWREQWVTAKKTGAVLCKVASAASLGELMIVVSRCGWSLVNATSPIAIEPHSLSISVIVV
ncbi:hypothetical protein PR048_019715 [Dryococelus australis]|uniref:Uncharacterized protein n=1 Tax=Dryococelus australis TaxID=614101 RepID=A0ABQ9H477_9NEOP|nr:hypothetical protein PR048_019715 [Dryococelus australis]